jgi:hypothetical protein
MMDLTDPRFHTRVIRWKSLIKDGYDPKTIMVEAQKQGMHRLANRAYARLRVERDAEKKAKGEK